MPISLVLLSLLGLAPFVGCGLLALGGHPDTAARMLTSLLAWGALALSFACGIHWGLVLREGAPASATATPVPGRHLRVGAAVLPLILAWVAVMLPLVTIYWLGLLLLILAYVAMLAVEHRFARAVALPTGYLLLRWVFTIAAVAMLVTVLTLGLLGQTIAF